MHTCTFVSAKFAILEDDVPAGQTVLIKFTNPALDYQQGEMKKRQVSIGKSSITFPMIDLQDVILLGKSILQFIVGLMTTGLCTPYVDNEHTTLKCEMSAYKMS